MFSRFARPLPARPRAVDRSRPARCHMRRCAGELAGHGTGDRPAGAVAATLDSACGGRRSIEGRGGSGSRWAAAVWRVPLSTVGAGAAAALVPIHGRCWRVREVAPAWRWTPAGRCPRRGSGTQVLAKPPVAPRIPPVRLRQPMLPCLDGPCAGRGADGGRSVRASERLSSRVGDEGDRRIGTAAVPDGSGPVVVASSPPQPVVA